ncbi:hypothetical protein HY256_10420 [Candidatus Sumerlaeota bacterium]|nr:hypothetical protein [Candidatus Sumerlaeota bacterium]
MALDQDFALVVINGTTQNRAGTVKFDADVYNCSAAPQIELSDADLKGMGTSGAIISTAGGDLEFLPLPEIGGATGIFRGTIAMAQQAVSPGNSILDITPGENIYAFYVDADNGSGSQSIASDMASLDCTGPIISNIAVPFIGFDRFTVTWNTNEPATSFAGAGLTCGPFARTATDITLAQNHSLTITGLLPCTDYFYGLAGTDAAGNEGINFGPGNRCFALRTLALVTSFNDMLEPLPDAGWTHNAAIGVDDWASVVFAQASSPTHAWFSADVSSYKDDFLITPPLTISADAFLGFMHTYKFESGSEDYDGGVIEISTDGGTNWTDLGPSIVQGGYNGLISSSFGSPIGGRAAWSGGVVGTMSEVRVSLGAFAGPNRKIRFRIACDSSVSATGWYVDDVQILTSGPCPNYVGESSWCLYE